MTRDSEKSGSEPPHSKEVDCSTSRRLQITLVSPYHGGSHRSWAEGLQTSSSHSIDLLTLPARYWKWRMHGGAVTLARRFLERESPSDLVVATDMLDLTTFLALTRQTGGAAPCVLYMHENQLTYPLPERGEEGPMRRQLGERDQHYAFVNYSSMLAAERILFNSRYHLEAFFDALPRFLKHFPEYNELASVRRLREKSRVLPVGIDWMGLQKAATDKRKAPPLIIWNQRWEYDKNPGEFFEALYRIADQSIPFRLAVCGQNFRRQPREFEEARERLADRIVHFGHAPRRAYEKLLWEAELTVSSAHHEFFGISILEAVACRTLPLLPCRLSYPELIPEEFHASCLYDGLDDLTQRLEERLRNWEETRRLAGDLAPSANRFCWSRLAPHYDRHFEELRGEVFVRSTQS